MGWGVVSVLLLVLGVGLFIIGVMIIRRGRFGRKLDDHPLCRRCGFDLFGNPGADRCGECGADLRTPGAVRIGHRQPRYRLISAGAVAGVIGLILVGRGAIGTIQQFASPSMKPLFLLLYDLRGRDAAARANAIKEIDARYRRQVLSTSAIDDIVDAALGLQANPAVPWDHRVGEWIEAEQKAGRLSSARWQQFVQHSIAGPPVMSPRPVVSRGQRLPLKVPGANGRVGWQTNLFVHATNSATITVDGIPVTGQVFDGSLGMSPYGIGEGWVDLSPAVDQLADGRHTLRVQRKMQVQFGWGDNLPGLHVFDIDQSVDFELRTGPPVTLKKDPSVRSAMEKKIRVEPGQMRPTHANVAMLHFAIKTQDLPIGVAYDVTLRVDGQDYKVGRFSVPANGGNRSFGMGDDLKRTPPLTVTTFDLVLTPSPEAAAKSIDTYEIWDEPMTLTNLPFKRFGSTQNP